MVVAWLERAGWPERVTMGELALGVLQRAAVHREAVILGQTMGRLGWERAKLSGGRRGWRAG